MKHILTAAQISIALDNEFNAAYPPLSTSAPPGKILSLANETRFNEANFSQPLTTYAVGLGQGGDEEADLNFLAPRVTVPRKFEYDSFDNIHELQSETDDDVRAPGDDFKRIEFRKDKVQAKTDNRGLAVVIDLDNVAPGENWEQKSVQKLMRRLRINALRRVNTLHAAGDARAETWNATAGQDPDADVLDDLVESLTLGGMRANRVFYGATAWQKRVKTLRAQSHAGGFSGIGTPEELGGLLMARIHVSKSVYQSSITAKSEVTGSAVYVFLQEDGLSTDDPSNIKRFVSPATNGGDFGVFSYELGPKRWLVAVEHYEKIATVKSGGLIYKAIT